MKKNKTICIVLFLISVIFLSPGCTVSTPEKKEAQTAITCPTCAPTKVCIQPSPPPAKIQPTCVNQHEKAEKYDIIIVYPVNDKEDNPEEHYTFDVSYPFIESKIEASSNFNEIVNVIIEQEISDFIKNVQEDKEFIEENLPDTKSSLIIDFTITNVSDNFISILFHVSFYITGSAHPNHYVHSITYNLITNQQMHLSDLFQPDSDYLYAFSKFSIDSLMQNDYINNDPEWLKTGAAPKEENFQNWNITPEGLLITFDPYQVAPYAAGFQEVTIPYSEIQSMIDNKSILGHFYE